MLLLSTRHDTFAMFVSVAVVVSFAMFVSVAAVDTTRHVRNVAVVVSFAMFVSVSAVLAFIPHSYWSVSKLLSW